MAPSPKGLEPQIRPTSSNLTPCAVKSDVAPLNFDLATAYRRAQNRQALGGGGSRERQRPLDKPQDDADDDDECILHQHPSRWVVEDDANRSPPVITGVFVARRTLNVLLSCGAVSYCDESRNCPGCITCTVTSSYVTCALPVHIETPQSLRLREGGEVL